MPQPFIFSNVPKNVILYKTGFHYALLWSTKPDFKQILESLEPLFGQPNSRFNYYSSYAGTVSLRQRYTEQKWFFGPKHWSASKHKNNTFSPHWVVFRTDKDRLLASIMI